MEKMAGKPLRWSLTSPKKRKKVMSQPADIHTELQAFPFDLMCFLDKPGSDHVGPFARESLTDYVDSRVHSWRVVRVPESIIIKIIIIISSNKANIARESRRRTRCRREHLDRRVGRFGRASCRRRVQPIGPFTSSEDYLVEGLRLTLDLIMRGECYAAQAVDTFLVHRFLLDSVPRILSYHGHDDGRYYLTHADNKGDHILVDDDDKRHPDLANSEKRTGSSPG